MSKLRVAFAGDRDISVWVLEYLLKQGVKPFALMVSDETQASHANELCRLCDYLPIEYVMVGKSFHELPNINLLSQLALDFIISIHFPYIYPKIILKIPRLGVLNLHPAYLPYNRGWHTPSWAIMENTPIGATLHFMDEGIDTGDIVSQEKLDISPSDTAHSLYTKLKQLELELFQATWASIMDGTYQRTPQQLVSGSVHKRKELFHSHVQKFDLDTPVRPKDLLRQLRGLTTNRLEEAAYFEMDNKRYRVQVSITEETIE